MLKRLDVDICGTGHYKYCLQLGSKNYQTKIYINSSLLTFSRDKTYLVLPKTNCSLFLDKNRWILKRANNSYTFAVFIYSGSYGKASITKIQPEPINIVYYRIINQSTGENSIGAIFTINKPLALISFKRDGKEIPPSLYEGSFQMKLNGVTRFI